MMENKPIINIAIIDDFKICNINNNYMNKTFPE